MTLVKVTVIHKVNRKAITVQNREAEGLVTTVLAIFHRLGLNLHTLLAMERVSVRQIKSVS